MKLEFIYVAQNVARYNLRYSGNTIKERKMENEIEIAKQNKDIQKKTWWDAELVIKQTLMCYNVTNMCDLSLLKTHLRYLFFKCKEQHKKEMQEFKRCLDEVYNSRPNAGAEWMDFANALDKKLQNRLDLNLGRWEDESG